MRGLRGWYLYEIALWLHVGNLLRHGFRNHLKCHLLQSILLSDWWKSNCATLPGFAYVLRAVLTNSPNSFPPERLFSIFNTTYDDDQKSSYSDYIELSMQSQFNKRVLR